MAPRRKLSLRQLEMLVEFAEQHRDISLGRFSGGPLANQAARQAWENVANRLNAVADGVIKTPEQWRRYWIEFKAKVKGKGASLRRDATSTGGGPSKIVPLTDLEERVLALIGPVAVEGLSGVRIPLEVLQIELNPETTRPDTPQEWREEVMHSPLPVSPPPEPAIHPVHEYSGVQENEDREFIGLEHNYHQNFVGTERPRTSHVPRTEDNSTPRQGRERVPRWAYDLESRRLDVEERIASSLESLLILMRDIRNDIREFMERN